MAKERAKLMAGMRRIVVKIGTSLSFDPAKGIDPRNVQALAGEVAELRRRGLEVVMVASGAIGAGMHRLKLKQRPKAMQEKQATAAVGQVYLMELLAREFGRHGLQAGQVLLTRQDLESGPRYFNARNTLDTLLRMGVVPVINENDTVAVDEIKFGDNDRLAALVCNLVKGDLLVILTDQDGLHSADPRKDPRARRIPLVRRIGRAAMASAGGEGSLVGTGGMVTKLLAAQMATRNGEHVVIARGSKRGVLRAVMRGADEGTLFLAPALPREKRLRWMPYTRQERCSLVVKPAAEARLRREHTPLCAADLKAVKGRFDPGDVVRLADGRGRTFAKALVREGSVECARLARAPRATAAAAELAAFKDMAFKQEF